MAEQCVEENPSYKKEGCDIPKEKNLARKNKVSSKAAILLRKLKLKTDFHSAKTCTQLFTCTSYKVKKQPSANLQENAHAEITLRHGCSPVNLLHIFRTHFYKSTSDGLLMNVNHPNPLHEDAPSK